jgi:Flp pilus assembly protein TadG
MATLMKPMRGFFRRTATDESGAATIPFVLFFPLFLTLVMGSLEMGMMMLRHVMLERALDLTVRDLRLGNWTPDPNGASPSDQLKVRICNNAGILPSCTSAMLVELRPVSKTTWQPLSSGATCVDRSQTVQPVTAFDQGGSNDMMLVRACIKVDTMFVTTGMGFGLPKDSTGAYALVSTTAFVNEPRPGS